ncbi:MAG: hypothetical protein SWK76_13795 [Actinomycetota bacterium]|nr:hypothetical protein [Actinomycetota bacterium]
MSVLYIMKDGGSYQELAVTPENTRKYIESVPLYGDDDDLLFWSRDKVREMQEQNFKRQMEWIWDGYDYYKRLFEAEGIEQGDIQSLDDQEKFL